MFGNEWSSIRADIQALSTDIQALSTDFLSATRARSYCVQYDESAFISRLLAEEGIGWSVEADGEAPAGHHLRLFADSRRLPEAPVSQTATGGQRIAAAPDRLPAELLELAAQRGYANAFAAHAADLPWRPQLEDQTGARLNPRPTAPGPMSALVVGPEGQTTPNGPDELWCDALGRVKIRFHWQQRETSSESQDSCWVRVTQRQAGRGMGWQWLPRIGQEVLVDFLGGDIDRQDEHFTA